MTDERRDVALSPLERRDPPALGGIELTGRLATTDSGVVYAGLSSGGPVAVVMLNEGAERDPYARGRFQQAAAAMGAAAPERGVAAGSDVTATVGGVVSGRSALVAADSDVDIAPWVAVPAESWADGLSAARALLGTVTLEQMPAVGEPAGPGFRPHWFGRRGVGRWRMWPLPWPSAVTAASRWTYVASFALVLAIAAIALWIAVKIFENQPPVPPGPGPGPLPLPTPISPSPGSPSAPTTPTPTPTTGPVSPGDTGSTAPPIV